MEFSLIILKEKLHNLEETYKKYVVTGGVGKESYSAKGNRKLCIDLQNAIKVLEEHVSLNSKV